MHFRRRYRHVIPDKQDGAVQPDGAVPGERRVAVSPEAEAALDQLSARLERLKKQAADLAACLGPKQKYR